MQKSSQLQIIHKKYIEFYNVYLTKTLKNNKFLYQTAPILKYLRKFFTTPPISLNPLLLDAIANTFKEIQKKSSLQEIILFLYFLSKNNKKIALNQDLI